MHDTKLVHVHDSYNYCLFRILLISYIHTASMYECAHVPQKGCGQNACVLDGGTSPGEVPGTVASYHHALAKTLS